MNQILIDSSFIYALYNPQERYHTQAQAFAKQQKDFTPVIVDVVITEVAFLFNRKGGIAAVIKFLEEFVETGTETIGLSLADLQHAGQIMQAYPTAALDFVDCAIMALSEHMNITQVCTYDRRDFAIFRPKHCEYLELLP